MLYHRYDLADLARAMAAGRDVLYHGTQSSKAILKSGKLFFAAIGHPVVCFTRCPNEAARWAGLKSDGDGRAAILIFDRRPLASRYRIEPYCDDPQKADPSRRDEMEERVWCTDIDISAHLIGYVSEEKVDQTPDERRRAREHLARFKSHPGRSVRTFPLEQCYAWAAQARDPAIAVRFEAEFDTDEFLAWRARSQAGLTPGDQSPK
jgi:hypothetical protein